MCGRRHSEKHTSWSGMPLGPNQTCAVAHGARSCPGRKRCRNVGTAARLGAEDGTWQNCILAHPAIRKRQYQRLSKPNLACCFKVNGLHAYSPRTGLHGLAHLDVPPAFREVPVTGHRKSSCDIAHFSTCDRSTATRVHLNPPGTHPPDRTKRRKNACPSTAMHPKSMSPAPYARPSAGWSGLGQWLRLCYADCCSRPLRKRVAAGRREGMPRE